MRTLMLADHLPSYCLSPKDAKDHRINRLMHMKRDGGPMEARATESRWSPLRGWYWPVFSCQEVGVFLSHWQTLSGSLAGP